MNAQSLQVDSVSPGFLRIPAALRYSGFSRSGLYRLMKDGRIKTACIKKRGALRGIRLISKESIDELILSSVAV